MHLSEDFQKLLVVLSKYNLISQHLPLIQMLCVTIFSREFNTKSEEWFSQTQIHKSHLFEIFLSFLFSESSVSSYDFHKNIRPEGFASLCINSKTLVCQCLY